MKYKRTKRGIERRLSSGKTLEITGWPLNYTIRINGTFVERFEYLKQARKYADENYK